MELLYYFQIASCVSSVFDKHPLAQAIPVSVSLLANLAPGVFQIGSAHHQLTLSEQLKLKKIEKIVDEIKVDLGIADMKTNLYVTSMMKNNAFCIGNSTSFTGPLIGISKEFFANFDSESIEMSPLYQKWRIVLKGLSDDPKELAKQLDLLSPTEQADIFSLATVFANTLTKEELKGILAHELGHAKNNHLITLPLLTQLALYGNIYGMEAVVRFFRSTTCEEVLPKLIRCKTLLPPIVQWLYVPLFLGSIVSAVAAMGWISVHGEWQADAECQTKAKYAFGLHQFMKKMLLVSLKERDIKKFPTCASQVSSMLNSWDLRSTHPNFARRMENALEMIRRPLKEPSKVSMVSKAIAGLGACVLGAQVVSHAYSLLSHYNFVKMSI